MCAQSAHACGLSRGGTCSLSRAFRSTRSGVLHTACREVHTHLRQRVDYCVCGSGRFSLLCVTYVCCSLGLFWVLGLIKGGWRFPVKLFVFACLLFRAFQILFRLSLPARHTARFICGRLWPHVEDDCNSWVTTLRIVPLVKLCVREEKMIPNAVDEAK